MAINSSSFYVFCAWHAQHEVKEIKKEKEEIKRTYLTNIQSNINVTNRCNLQTGVIQPNNHVLASWNFLNKNLISNGFRQYFMTKELSLISHKFLFLDEKPVCFWTIESTNCRKWIFNLFFSRKRNSTNETESNTLARTLSKVNKNYHFFFFCYQVNSVRIWYLINLTKSMCVQ